MTQNGVHWTLERSIPSNTEAGAEVVLELMERLEQCEWIQPELFGINLAVEEALVNAIKHGNHEDAGKQVHVEFRLNDHHFYARIADEGDGFDPGDVPDPTADENLDRPGGRGIMLMRNFMTRVEFNEMGNQVILEKRAEPE
ncbi:MAG: ATP-binding protein [Planctomycetes bacterium]|nr:ATP-binding protein [Planctomycetota bacterium]